MSAKKQYLEARKAILEYLDEDCLTPDRSKNFYGTETAFDINNSHTDIGQARRELFFDTLKNLIEDGLVTSSSSPDRLPITGLKLTPKGIMRSQNIWDTYKEHGLKAAITAIVSNLGRYLVNKYE